VVRVYPKLAKRLHKALFETSFPFAGTVYNG
jgi:hypothetical protein